MDLTIIWGKFISILEKDSYILEIERKVYSGFPFLYISTFIEQKKLDDILFLSAAKVMKGKRLQADILFVREQDGVFVYRMRFYVPNEKLVCCGRGCRDCIRFRTT
jgi:hypothetical protein